MTDAERALWTHLRAGQLAGLKFRRQVPLDPYVADFLCWERKLVIEIDGGQHAENDADVARQRVIEAMGFLVLRFWNHDVLTNMDGVLATIAEAIHNAEAT